MPHSDHKKVIQVRNDQAYFEDIYKVCKPLAMGFMRQYVNPNISRVSLEEIYQDALMVLYEKIFDESFTWEIKIQTYVNKVCKRMLFKKLRKKRPIVISGDDGPDIADVNEDLEPIKDAKFEALYWAFEELSRKGGKCAEMLKLFWYHKKSIKQLTEYYDFKNDATTKVQKSRCQRRLKKLATNYILQ